MKHLLAAVILASVVGCVQGCTLQLDDSERYLTKEQDARMRQLCEAHGCKVVPLPAWRNIEQQLRGATKT